MPSTLSTISRLRLPPAEDPHAGAYAGHRQRRLQRPQQRRRRNSGGRSVVS